MKARVMKKMLLFVLISTLVFGCVDQKKDVAGRKSANQINSKYSPQDAKWFDIQIFADYKHLKIFSPWGEHKLLGEYILFRDVKKIPDSLSTIPAVQIPVQRMVCLSASHFEPAEQLGVLQNIVGVGDAKYVQNNELSKRITNGDLQCIAPGGHIDEELLLDLKSDIVLVSPFENSNFRKFTEMGITIVPFPDYLELKPLGRTEYMMLMAYFFDKEEKALQFISEIRNDYESNKKLASTLVDKPKILSGKPFKDLWYLPGGKSYIAQIIEDAGGDYYWKNNDQTGAFPLDFEVVYDRAIDADIWRLTVSYSGEYTKSVLEGEDERFADFEAFKKNKLLVSNSYENLYYERAGMYPNLVLKDFIKAFHPDLLPNYVPHFYSFVKK